MSDYKQVFGREPEPWREPLGALRLTLTPNDPKPWVDDYGNRYLNDMSPTTPTIYDPRPDYDPPWTLECARDECEELVRVLNEMETE